MPARQARRLPKMSPPAGEDHVEAAKTVRDGGMAETGEPRDSGGNGRAARWHGRSASRSRRREAKANDVMILGGEDSVAAGQMNGGVQYIVRAVPKGRAGGRLERKPRRWCPARLRVLGSSFSFSGV
jgi:hypothetical protein